MLYGLRDGSIERVIDRHAGSEREDAINLRDPDATTAAALERIRQVPFLGDFAEPLPRLTEPGAAGGKEGVERTFRRFSGLLGEQTDAVRLRFRVVDDGGENCWCIEAGPEGNRVTGDVGTRADVEVIVDDGTWAALAEARMSPLEAFGLGRMRVRGDVNVAWRVVRRLHRAAANGSEGR
ncbi:SCP2 sterol-binding domain-containing protein [Streptomyces sp. P1-3]|uniref:SCP2 sterol-binding domain-containing protein n=1 Tax=Streptomyces sp. P1-3 TaxID=3421658 RepID=UPI003D365DC6